MSLLSVFVHLHWRRRAEDQGSVCEVQRVDINHRVVTKPSTRLFPDTVCVKTIGRQTNYRVVTLPSHVENSARVRVDLLLDSVVCQGWKATSDCSPYGRRDEQGDRSCTEIVPSSSSGFCACEDGKRTAFSDCRHAPFTCQEQCALLPRRVCDAFDPSLRSNTASGCSHSVLLANTLVRTVDIFRVNDHGIDVHLLTLSQRTNYTVVFAHRW